MAAKPRQKADLEAVVPGIGHNSYFAQPKTQYKFVKTGCTLLDCALGGGWVLGTIANLVGDKSTAKTALGVEALNNFMKAYPKGKAAYRDAEAAFDQTYANAMGLKVDEVDFGDVDEPIVTMEDFAHDVDKFVSSCLGDNVPGIYILDSLDSLTTEDELTRKLGDQGYGTGKAKLLSELFRRITRKVEQADVLLLIISQLRDNIGAMMGEKHKRSGGRALDFYSSQIVWLARLKTLDKTIKKIKRAYGLSIKANVKKNKIGMAHRTCNFDFIFGYGVEDVGASLAWLEEIGRLDEVGALDIENLTEDEYYNIKPMIDGVVMRLWYEADASFLPRRRKYVW